MNYLEAERVRRGWSKSRMARELGLNQTTIIEATTGRRRLGPEQLVTAAAGLGWAGDPAELMEEVEPL